MTDEKVCFAQIDGHLDSNPKVVKAGSVHATAVFEFLLRRVAISRSNGVVPVAFIDPEYLARTLFMSCDEARHGTSRAVTAKLIDIDEASGLVYIVGWSDEWGRRPKDGAARTASWRERNKPKDAQVLAYSSVTKRHTSSQSSHVTDGDESDGSEEKRREEIRREEIQKKNSARPSGGGLHAGSESKRKPKPSDATADERETALWILGKLGQRSGVKYSGAAEHVRLIVRHLREGVTEQDMRKVIGYCAVELKWADKPDMQPYLRPETLFGPKTIAKYLDPARAWFEANPGLELDERPTKGEP